jgi:hypothetical protein
VCSNLHYLKEVVLDRMPVDRCGDVDALHAELGACTLLDVSRTLINDFAHVRRVCNALPKLTDINCSFVSGTIHIVTNA